MLSALRGDELVQGVILVNAVTQGDLEAVEELIRGSVAHEQDVADGIVSVRERLQHAARPVHRAQARQPERVGVVRVGRDDPVAALEAHPLASSVVVEVRNVGLERGSTHRDFDTLEQRGLVVGRAHDAAVRRGAFDQASERVVAHPLREGLRLEYAGKGLVVVWQRQVGLDVPPTFRTCED
jgi:hypothetical protein